MKKIEIAETYFFQSKFFTKVIMVMKITVFFLLFVVSSSFAKISYSQNTRLSLHLENVTLQQVFDEIQKKSEFIIFYKDNQVDVNHLSNIDFDEATVDQILDQALKSTDLGYKIIDRQIVILSDNSKESSTSIKSGTTTEQPKKEISGTIRDSKETPLPGVSVVVKGTTTGTITDADGKFRIAVPDDATTLAFTFIGMKKQEINIGNNSTINVTLAEEVVGIEEIVAIGYGTARKKDITGSISSVSSANLETRSIVSVQYCCSWCWNICLQCKFWWNPELHHKFECVYINCQ